MFCGLALLHLLLVCFGFSVLLVFLGFGFRFRFLGFDCLCDFCFTLVSLGLVWSLGFGFIVGCCNTGIWCFSGFVAGVGFDFGCFALTLGLTGSGYFSL